MAFSLDRRDTIVYTVFVFADALIVLILLAGSIVSLDRPSEPADGTPSSADRTIAEANRAQLSAAMRSYAVVAEKRTPRMNVHVFGLPGAPSLNSAIESKLLTAIEGSGGFAGRAAFDPPQTAPVHRWPKTSFNPPISASPAAPAVGAASGARTREDGPLSERAPERRTIDIASTVLTSGGRYIVTALRQRSPRPRTEVLLTDLEADTTVDAQKLFSMRIDPAEISVDATGALTVQGETVEDGLLSDLGRSVSAALRTSLELPQPGDRRSPDFSCALLPCVALTYDDGPGRASTEQALLDAADTADIRLTYFLLGRNIDEYPHAAERIVAAGHEVDSHTYRHPRLDRTESAKIRREVHRTQKSLRSVGQTAQPLVRPPYGALDRRSAHVLDRPAIIWNVDTDDWRDRDPRTTVRRVKERTHPGSVVLMHSIHPTTVEAAPAVFAAVADKGLYAVTVRELFDGIDWEPGGSYFCRGYADELCSNPEHPSVHKD